MLAQRRIMPSRKAETLVFLRQAPRHLLRTRPLRSCASGSPTTLPSPPSMPRRRRQPHRRPTAQERALQGTALFPQAPKALRRSQPPLPHPRRRSCPRCCARGWQRAASCPRSPLSALSGTRGQHISLQRHTIGGRVSGSMDIEKHTRWLDAFDCHTSISLSMYPVSQLSHGLRRMRPLQMAAPPRHSPHQCRQHRRRPRLAALQGQVACRRAGRRRLTPPTSTPTGTTPAPGSAAGPARSRR